MPNLDLASGLPQTGALLSLSLSLHRISHNFYMELPPSPSSHHFGVRKPGEPGLAEWAQKIRALQRQVDADEEEEHKKLEQEINASRLARVRRSAGYSRVSLNPAAGTLFLMQVGWIDPSDVRVQWLQTSLPPFLIVTVLLRVKD